jgi:hypothetical protein
VDAAKRRQLAGFWLEWGWIRDVGNVAYTKHERISDCFGKWGGFGFRGVVWFVYDVGWVSGIVGWPNANAYTFLITCGDFEFGVSNEGIKGFVPTDEEPRVIDEFKG